MADKPAEEQKLIEEFKFYTDPGSLKALKSKRIQLLKSGSGGQTKASTTIPIWMEDDDGFDPKDYKPVIVKVYSIEKKSKPPKTTAKPVEYLYLLALISIIVAGYFIINIGGNNEWANIDTVKLLILKVTDTRHELIAQQITESKDDLGIAMGISGVLVRL